MHILAPEKAVVWLLRRLSPSPTDNKCWNMHDCIQLSFVVYELNLSLMSAIPDIMYRPGFPACMLTHVANLFLSHSIYMYKFKKINMV